MSNITVINGVKYRNLETHETHCCAKHGCKYGDQSGCPVEVGAVLQQYSCEMCHSTSYLESQIEHLREELLWSSSLESRGIKIFGYNEF